MLDDASAQAESVAQRVIEFEGDVATAEVIDVVETSEPSQADDLDSSKEQ
jgi:segregation and condensation protein B